ncbi:hypothetical protein Mnod_7430 [Methylobacterium nodulans ORS 2060]|uniref:Uncharacterized protein n=1 Tax=Methylobacterium nodulans (strain LMG 21967 / CNCM I-2342 / ORS 2060) TaxID=460265 RepID=B8IN51_METNO|nr:hypothetical protein Mnod_7430 [Methylobacterium nodulans ORS 2060]
MAIDADQAGDTIPSGAPLAAEGGMPRRSDA